MTNVEAIKAKLLREIGQNGDFAYPRNPDGPEAVAVIEALVAENERLREALREVFGQWAGSEGFIPETAPEGYLLGLTKRMALTARAALKDAARD